MAFAVFPVLCEMKIAGLDNVVWTKERLEFWDSVYGFKMSAMKPLLYEEASVEHVHANLVSTSVCTFRAIDAEKVTLAELEFSSPFSLTAPTKHTLNAFIGKTCFFFFPPSHSAYLISPSLL